MRLQAKTLLAVVPLTVLPLLGLGWFAYDQLRTTAEQRSVGQMMTLLDQLQLNVQSKLNSSLANVRLFADSTLVRNYALTEDEGERYALMLPSLLKRYRSYLDSYPDYDEIRLLLPDGYEDARATRDRLPNAQEEEGESAWFRELRAFKGESFTRLFDNPDNAKVSLLIARPLRLINHAIDDPVRAKPILRGYLAVTMGLGFLEQQVQANRVGKTGILFVIDREGRVLFHPDAKQLRTRLPAALVARLLRQGHRGAHIHGEYLAQPVVLGARVLHQDLLAVGVLPVRELLAGSHRLGAVFGWVLAATLLVTVSLVFALMRYLLVNPVQRLRWAAREIGRGNLKPALALGTGDELGDLATSFVEMGENLASSHQKIKYLAYHDSLTGLPNRLMFREYLQHMIAMAKRKGVKMALLFLDLDNFKRVNDTLGHPVGDRLLKEMADRLSATLRAEDYLHVDQGDDTSEVLARLGGDEFTILLPEIAEGHDAAKVARRILAVMKEPFRFDGHELYSGTSIGITVYPADGEDASDLIKRADVAMYHAKEQGKGNFQFYSESFNVATLQHFTMEKKLRSALEKGELELYYQPQVAAGSGRIVGAEALLRWNDPDIGMVMPNQFIPLAEEAGLILPLGEWVIQQACRQNKAWQDAGLGPIAVSVNVSGVQFQRQDLNRILLGALSDSGLESRYLEAEVTETALMSIKQGLIDKLDGIKELGVAISLDDFGTGYSSLNYLRRFPIDKLKIDRSFVPCMEEDTEDAAIVSAILFIAKSLGLETTAEGVETEGQRELLVAGGCDYIQGYLFGRPVPAREMQGLLRDSPVLAPQRADEPRRAPAGRKMVS